MCIRDRSQSAGLFSRRQEIEDLRKKIGSLQNRQGQAQAAADKLKAEVEALNAQLTAASSEAITAGGDKIRAEGELRRIEAAISQAQAAAQLRAAECEQLNETIRQSRTELELSLIHILPIEVMAGRGADTMRFGPLRPVGLTDPRTCLLYTSRCV